MAEPNQGTMYLDPSICPAAAFFYICSRHIFRQLKMSLEGAMGESLNLPGEHHSAPSLKIWIVQGSVAIKSLNNDSVF